jgi:hypothetical protein
MNTIQKSTLNVVVMSCLLAQGSFLRAEASLTNQSTIAVTALLACKAAYCGLSGNKEKAFKYATSAGAALIFGVNYRLATKDTLNKKQLEALPIKSFCDVRNAPNKLEALQDYYDNVIVGQCKEYPQLKGTETVTLTQANGVKVNINTAVTTDLCPESGLAGTACEKLRKLRDGTGAATKAIGFVGSMIAIAQCQGLIPPSPAAGQGNPTTIQLARDTLTCFFQTLRSCNPF